MLIFNIFWILVRQMSLTHGNFFNRITRLQVLDAWGLAGVRTDKIGFKHVWEIW